MIGTWIALTDQILENDWLWYTTLMTLSQTGYSNWQRGQPNNYREEDCTELGWEGAFGWNDVFCNQEQNLICENLP